MKSALIGCAAALILSALATAGEPIATRQMDAKTYLNCNDVAEQLNYELKVVQPNRLITFCRQQPTEICIPVRLDERDIQRHQGELFVSESALVGTLGFDIERRNGKLFIAPAARKPSAPQSPASAYNAPWPRGRGFQKGDTLPDIPLVDLDGNEVRFSKFLGRRYILYVWASW